jgi:hypothetical protein
MGTATVTGTVLGPDPRGSEHVLVPLGGRDSTQGAVPALLVLDEPETLEGPDVRVHAAGGRQADLLAELTQRRREPAPPVDPLQGGQDVTLPARQVGPDHGVGRGLLELAHVGLLGGVDGRPTPDRATVDPGHHVGCG